MSWVPGVCICYEHILYFADSQLRSSAFSRPKQLHASAEVGNEGRGMQCRIPHLQFGFALVQKVYMEKMIEEQKKRGCIYQAAIPLSLFSQKNYFCLQQSWEGGMNLLPEEAIQNYEWLGSSKQPPFINIWDQQFYQMWGAQINKQTNKPVWGIRYPRQILTFKITFRWSQI